MYSLRRPCAILASLPGRIEPSRRPRQRPTYT